MLIPFSLRLTGASTAKTPLECISASFIFASFTLAKKTSSLVRWNSSRVFPTFTPAILQKFVAVKLTDSPPPPCSWDAVHASSQHPRLVVSFHSPDVQLCCHQHLVPAKAQPQQPPPTRNVTDPMKAKVAANAKASAALPILHSLSLTTTLLQQALCMKCVRREVVAVNNDMQSKEENMTAKLLNHKHKQPTANLTKLKQNSWVYCRVCASSSVVLLFSLLLSHRSTVSHRACPATDARSTPDPTCPQHLIVLLQPPPPKTVRCFVCAFLWWRKFYASVCWRLLAKTRSTDRTASRHHCKNLEKDT